MAKTFLDNLKWRQATKKFDIRKDISEIDLNKILKAIRYTPSSYGLQSYHIYVIKDQELKKKLKEKSFGQEQIDSCAYLLIFCARTDRQDLEKRINDYAQLANQDPAALPEKVTSLKTMLKSFLDKKSDEEIINWATKQVYIALGFGLAACAEMQIDSCPMEGFAKEEIDKILQLPKGLKSTVYLAIGYREADLPRQKIRFASDDLFSFR
ncbi:MAG: NAD(P)H-dependent oxidoreductase [Candidatus Komeilibacteria bacterium CG11_big_fil_rev_8_21_14_0_20_36_20]|uniref:NAD(P)H-dependent oxidoreductase n=1 Tax=Candidatus Komeilibacteria bacterium CG11_big_fil_rev_8_21_14_0_20_36_20 TaxID=1974477 RepID=A0A2H0NEB5_9BACT|nr:MAG: NAD(P)H-dependent oxidoreductase [Candidatus Komeilibacteria bacterium CG11_big_fil_rev_8_21_14_0_20_36_20]PIR81682.1 MAG: NAD(P)H-dependent oxidoreductase [Candidatus Komeilibacteria bacterium CG10_big_fil_rev_8_21_14_0_10_36_65]PJC55613.1 MAG: NAD(P)H-dependent oxidoreductase [Candidatus Komeilibacteria bacterium CG_4_9_14_0_2_um_filter_36_13]